MFKRIVEKKRADGSYVFKIDRTARKGFYVINDDSSQRKYIDRIELQGFDAFPTGLYREGAGLVGGGYSTLVQLCNRYRSGVRLTISRVSNSSVRKSGKRANIVLFHDDLKHINDTVRRIKSERKQEIDGQVSGFLARLFPKEFTSVKGRGSYNSGSVAKLLRTPGALKALSDADKQAIGEAYPQIMQAMQLSLSPQNIRVIAEGLTASKKIYLKKVIGEFEARLKKNSTEHAWQAFLRDTILMLVNSYVAIIEKQSVDIGGKFPDFMLVDPYGYLDIYEIKKPQTGVLRFDDSRGNYFWDVEICKAISQVENYIDHTARHNLDIVEKIKKKKGQQVKIVRPRGYIIAGRRVDLVNDDMKEDFRILNDSLKNIDIIFYDDLLGNLKVLLERLTKKS